MLFTVGKVQWHRDLLSHPGIAREDLIAAFEQYICGNWGTVSAGQALENDVALTNGDAILGRYLSNAGVPFCISTDDDGTMITLAQHSSSQTELADCSYKKK